MIEKKNSTYIIGVSWFIGSLIISVMLDVITKYTCGKLHSTQISFFRCFFSAVTLIPAIFFYGKKSIKTSYIFIHIIRGTLLFFAVTSWTYSLNVVAIPTATVISFTIPIFVLVLAVFFLDEKVPWYRWIATLAGFIGIALVIKPSGQSFNFQVVLLLVAAISFSMLDIINKKYIIKETILSMLFYSALVTSILSAPSAIIHWQKPEIYDLILLIMLGLGANSILFFLLKALALVDATSVAPYRYLELLLSSLASYFLFGDIPDFSTWYGAGLIIPATLFIAYSEVKKTSK